jgi:hypothetical protein
LFGVIPDPDYPVCDLPIRTGDRFLLYTDGAIEPENASGDSFGDWKLEQVVRTNQSRPPSELSDKLLSEIRLWQPASLAQHDDITLIVISRIATGSGTKCSSGQIRDVDASVGSSVGEFIAASAILPPTFISLLDTNVQTARSASSRNRLSLRRILEKSGQALPDP